jgi:hypothetical protein
MTNPLPLGRKISAVNQFLLSIRVTVGYELDHNPPSNNVACSGSKPCHERLAVFSK